MWKYFKKPDPASAREKQLNDASMSIIDHEAALEYHKHMVAMYKERINRIIAREVKHD